MERHPNAVIETIAVEGVEDGDTPAPNRMRTDRLVLRRPDAVGFDRLHALFSDVTDAGEVFELCGWDRHDDEAATRAYLDDRRARWARGEFHEYVLEADGELVGTACLDAVDDGAFEFGFWLRKPHWGRGFAGEGVDALVHAAFGPLAAPYVVAGCLPANDRSRRAIERFVRRYGGAYAGSPPTVSSSLGEVVPHHEWVITREGYDAGEAGLSTLVPGVGYDDLAFTD